MKDQIQGQKICILMRFYEELVKFIIGPKVLLIGPFRFLRPNIYFEFVRVIWYELLSDYLLVNDCSRHETLQVYIKTKVIR